MSLSGKWTDLSAVISNNFLVMEIYPTYLIRFLSSIECSGRLVVIVSIVNRDRYQLYAGIDRMIKYIVLHIKQP